LIKDGNIFKRNYKPEDFRLRVTPRFKSINDTKYFQCEYSRNKGRTWHVIHCSHSPFLGSIDYDYEWVIYSFKLSDNTAKWLKEKFNSYEAIKEFEESEYKEFLEGNKKLEAQRLELLNKHKEKIDKINKELE
jgi:hypothetical protein